MDRNKVRVLKISTGEEIVSEIDVSGECLILKNPVKFSMIHTDKGVGLQMQQYIMLSDDKEIKIKQSHVLSDAAPVSEVLDAYEQQFSDILLPPEKSLIT